jgi:anti-sigma28 factor (negative regulator of flagellin synthesis)
MKIQNINNFMSYKTNSKPAKNDEAVKTKKYDIIDIKSKSANDSDNLNISTIKKKVVSQINEETSLDKISRIKESINNKTYSIDVDEIVRKLLH